MKISLKIPDELGSQVNIVFADSEINIKLLDFYELSLCEEKLIN